jgi:hypothetical protein
MLLILRKIRKNYPLYKVGKVFLVVIGILIALQINNWNSDKQQHILSLQK